MQKVSHGTVEPRLTLKFKIVTLLPVPSALNQVKLKGISNVQFQGEFEWKNQSKLSKSSIKFYVNHYFVFEKGITNEWRFIYWMSKLIKVTSKFVIVYSDSLLQPLEWLENDVLRN